MGRSAPRDRRRKCPGTQTRGCGESAVCGAVLVRRWASGGATSIVAGELRLRQTVWRAGNITRQDTVGRPLGILRCHHYVELENTLVSVSAKTPAAEWRARPRRLPVTPTNGATQTQNVEEYMKSATYLRVLRTQLDQASGNTGRSPRT